VNVVGLQDGLMSQTYVASVKNTRTSIQKSKLLIIKYRNYECNCKFQFRLI